MGTLRPGASFRYEKHGDYTISIDEETNKRSIVGYDYSQNYASTTDSILDNKCWGDLRQEAKTNVALQHALDRAIMIYKLSKDNPL